MFNLFSNSHPCIKKSLTTSYILSKNLPIRGIKLHEYQAGKLLHKYKVPIPIGDVAFTAQQALKIAKEFYNDQDKHSQGHREFVVKA